MHAGSGIEAQPDTSQMPIRLTPNWAEVRQLLQTAAAVRFKMIGRWACKISGIQNHLPLMQVMWKIKKDCQDRRRFGDE